MYAYLRLATMVLKNTFRKKEVFDHTTSYVWTFRPGLADLDVYPEVNNGRHFVLFDLARYDLALRTGLFRWVRKTRSAFVVAGSTIRYRHRLRPWRRTQILTDLVGMDDRFFLLSTTDGPVGTNMLSCPSANRCSKERCDSPSRGHERDGHQH